MKIWDDLQKLVFEVREIIVYVFMALSAKVRCLAIFQFITYTSKDSEVDLTSLAFSLFHFGLKNNKRILFLNIWINSILTIKPDIFENNHVITAIHVSIEIRPSKDNSKIFYFGQVHGELMQISLVAVFDIFY